MKKFVLIALLALIAGGAYYFVQHRRDADTDIQVACTMEALICPDGSGVGRSGPQCKFEACPNQPSFSGILRQIGGKFYLEMPAPFGLPEEARIYNMPLQFKMVTNVLGQIIGKRVEVTGKFIEGNTLEVENLKELSS